ncbi:MAG: type IV pilus secretin PilQ [Thiotrichales bacterium]
MLAKYRINRGGWLGIALSFLLLVLAVGQPASANTNTLESMDFSRLSGDRVQIELGFSSLAPTPLSFTIANPARITLDFPNTLNDLSDRSKRVQLGSVQSVTTAQARDRTRLVVNLSRMMNYQTETKGNKLLVTLAPPGAPPATSSSSDTTPADLPIAEFVKPEPVSAPPRVPAAKPAPAYQPPAATSQAAQPKPMPPVYSPPEFGVTNIDFRRGVDGAGRVLISLRNPNTPLDIKQQGSNVVVNLKGVKLPEHLQRRMDVVDFSTPVQTIDARSLGNSSEIVIKAKGNFSQLAYQSDNIYAVEIRPVSEKKLKAQEKQITYKGERLSLNFQEIEVRSVLQLIGDFTGINVVVDDSVKGTLTLRLQDVPWDQALDIILKTKRLAKRQKGNVLYIADADKLAEREEKELKAASQVQELAPLRTEIINLNYADAKEMATLLQSSGGGSSSVDGGSGSSNSVLSSRGSVSLDRRTNSLLVQDTAQKIDEIRALIKSLDVPVRQVMIESRIVTASDTFTRELGVNFGVSNTDNSTSQQLTTNFAVSVPTASDAGTLGLALAKFPAGVKLDLELSAAQIEDRAEIVASPRIITSNKNRARIEQGVEIPYQEKTSSGATNTSFKKAVLSLEVIPHITKDNRINMELVVNRDSVGEVFNGIPSISTREVETQVLVENGQTIVLGGIFEESKLNGSTRVPFFGDLPIVGHLFRNNTRSNDKSELLIFVTPKIINENLSIN